MKELTDFTDAELAQQPIGYWTGAAKTAIAAFINGRMATLGMSQPHWWTLHRVGEHPKTLDDLLAVMRRTRPYVDAASLVPAVEDLLASGHLDRAGGTLHLTPAGDALRDQLRAQLGETLARVHEGVSTDDYVLVVKVLRRMIANAGGDPGFAFE
ncbi:MarR family winged helix-turn-helix transcriptional regulator [Lentzea sp. NPDC054927]